MQLSQHLYFFMELIKIAKAKAITMEGNVVDAEKELSEAEARVTKIERVLGTKETCE